MIKRYKVVEVVFKTYPELDLEEFRKLLKKQLVDYPAIYEIVRVTDNGVYEIVTDSKGDVHTVPVNTEKKEAE